MIKILERIWAIPTNEYFPGMFLTQTSDGVRFHVDLAFDGDDDEMTIPRSEIVRLHATLGKYLKETQ